MIVPILEDFKNVKRTMEDSKRYGLNSYFQHGFRLLQDVETRFSAVYLVLERFLKFMMDVRNIILSENKNGEHISFESLI